MSDIDERLEEEILHAYRKSFDSQQAGINLNFLMDIQREIERLRADLAAVTEERDYVMAEGLFSADQIRILRAERDTAIAERDAAIEERDYVMAEGLFRDEQNEDLRKTVSKIWEQLGNPTYKELNGRTIHDLIDSVIYERNDIAARLREENERLREAFEKAANDMRPMLRSLISRNEAEEIVRRAARAAIEGVTEPASPWRDIESAPRDGTIIFVWDESSSPEIVAAYYTNDYWVYADQILADADPEGPIATHWMPLPEPPR